MKRVKERDEQIASLGPMFPRLHVNDAADKGGPRAPPRNKMALYEQLTIPSQRFDRQSLPPSRNGTTTNLAPPALASQGSRCDRSALYPHRLPPSAPTHLSENFIVRKSDATKASTSTSRMKSRKRARAEEDFTVPVYVRLSTGLSRGQNGTTRSTSDHSVKILTVSKKDLRQDSQSPEARVQQNANSNRLRDDGLVDAGKRIGSRQRNDFRVGEVPRIPAELNGDICDLSMERTRGPLLIGVGDRGDDVSESSMIYSMPEADFSPDDVVEIIGQKQFWKARKALVNQQRVFAVQVFELHRLIKVQRLMAESPHLLLEDLSLMVPPSNNLTIEIIKPSVRNPQHMDDPQKQAHRIEQSTGDGVSTSVLRSHHPHVGDTDFVPVAPDNNRTDFWAYHQQQPPKHQWLIPVMSPSEGLVYKPYTGPGYMGPYNGQGPTPFPGSFMAPACGVPTHFPTYGAPITGSDFSGSSVGQINRSHQQSEEDPDMNMQHQSSSNDPRQKPGPAPPKTFRESEVRRSTGSNISERPTEGARSVLPLFPTVQRVLDGGSEPCESSQQPTQVIKVIPHNRRFSSESAARIFRSIQEERKVYE